MPPLDEDGSKGEERRGALLVLPGCLVSKDTASAERSDPANGETEVREQLPALPSCNPLRPLSNLHMGWYRPAERINKQHDGRAEANDSTPAAGRAEPAGGSPPRAGLRYVEIASTPETCDGLGRQLRARRSSRALAKTCAHAGAMIRVPRAALILVAGWLRRLCGGSTRRIAVLHDIALTKLNPWSFVRLSRSPIGRVGRVAILIGAAALLVSVSIVLAGVITAPSHNADQLPASRYRAQARPKTQARKVAVRHQQSRAHRRRSSAQHHRPTTTRVVEARYSQAPSATAAAASVSQSSGTSSDYAGNAGASAPAASTGAATSAAAPASNYSPPATQSSPAASQPAATTTPVASNGTSNGASTHTSSSSNSSAFGAAPGSLGPGSSPDG